MSGAFVHARQVRIRFDAGAVYRIRCKDATLAAGAVPPRLRRLRVVLGVTATTSPVAMYAYIVLDPTSDNFKFGISNRPDDSRFASYGTSFGKFDGFVIACNNTLEVELALKRALADHIVKHPSGRPSEVVLRGENDANVMLAVRTIMDVRTLSRTIDPVVPNIGDSPFDASDDDESAGPDDDDGGDARLRRLLAKANAEPLAFSVAQVAAHLLRGSYTFAGNAGWRDEERGLRLNGLCQLNNAVVEAVMDAAHAQFGSHSALARAVQRRSVVSEAVGFMRDMLADESSRYHYEVNPLRDWLSQHLVIDDVGASILTQTEILNRLKATWRGFQRYKVSDVKKFIAAYFKEMDVWFGEGSFYRENGQRTTTIHAKGVRFCW